MRAKTVGQNVRRVDAVGKVTGKTLYPGDLRRDAMVHMKIIFSDRPHARIRFIDTEAAEAQPGVVAVFTAKDVPVNEYGLMVLDQPVLCGPGSDKIGGDIVRTTMDQVAVVVAESEESAFIASRLIKVDYEDLPAVFDPFEAMEPDAPQLHPDSKNNILVDYHIRKGDMSAGGR